MAISDKLQDLIDIKQDIKVAIENKDVDMTGVDFGGYAVKIELLPAVVELTQAQYDALPPKFELVWGIPTLSTGACPVVGYNPIGTSCSFENEKMAISALDLGIATEDCFELTCYSKETTYDDNTYYLIVEEE